MTNEEAVARYIYELLRLPTIQPEECLIGLVLMQKHSPDFDCVKVQAQVAQLGIEDGIIEAKDIKHKEAVH